MRTTPYARFYRNDRTKHFGNPMRRWLYHYLVAGSVLLGAGYMTMRYQLAAWKTRRHCDTAGEWMCSSTTTDFLLMLPLNRLSNAVGSLASPGVLPPSVHRRLIELLVWWYGVTCEDAEERAFDSLQDFYVRHWKPAARPVDEQATLVAPCDGVLLSVQDRVTDNALMQVKGLSYGLGSLLRLPRIPEVPTGMRRVAVVLHMRVKDFHHVIAPADFGCHGAIYVPGGLLPSTPGGYHCLPGLFLMNERVVVHGTLSADRRSCGATVNGERAAGGDGVQDTTTRLCRLLPVPWPLFSSKTGAKTEAAAHPRTPMLALALIGSTLSGNIKLALDPRVRTNFLSPPEFVVHSVYPTHPTVSRGNAVGTFYWGSAVVMVADVPENAHWMRRVGETVKAGEALVSQASEQEQS